MLSSEDLIKIFAKPGDLARKIHQKAFVLLILLQEPKEQGVHLRNPQKSQEVFRGKSESQNGVGWKGPQRSFSDHLGNLSGIL